MSGIEHFVRSPFAAAIGWALLHSLWEGVFVAGLLAVVLIATRSPRTRYASACGAMLLMIVGFGATLFLLLPHGGHSAQSWRPIMVAAWNPLAAARTSRFWSPSLTTIAPWLAPLWMAGVLLLYMRSLMSCLSVQRLRRRGVCSAQKHWQAELSRLGARLRVSRTVVLLESSLAEVPMVLGHFKPLILIPVGLLAGLSAAQVEVILLHELAHIRRRDYLINALQRLCEGLFFYHPAAWWISSVMRAERECCCDDLVVSITGNRHEYARTLTTLEQFRLVGAEPAVALTGGRLMKRIERLLYPKKGNASWAPLLAASVLVLAGALTVAAWRTKASERPMQATSSAAVTMTDSYNKWLNEDVVYIIDDAERAAFAKLTTGAERDEFIRQFWQRRNPTPNSSKNPFKDEHYRRIAFANEHLRTASGEPGWRTDRGHILILYGPPDEIDSHPKEAQKPGIEVWTYRHIDGLGDNDTITFIDRTGHGDYHLAPGNAR